MACRFICHATPLRARTFYLRWRPRCAVRWLARGGIRFAGAVRCDAKRARRCCKDVTLNANWFYALLIWHTMKLRARAPSLERTRTINTRTHARIYVRTPARVSMARVGLGGVFVRNHAHLDKYLEIIGLAVCRPSSRARRAFS